MNKDTKKIFIITRGCQMNTRDSEFAMGLMLGSGFRKTSSAKNADVVLFNSCSVRKHAEDRLFNNISDLKDLKKKKPDLVIGLLGCTAQGLKNRVFEHAPIVDFVCGPGNESDLPKIVKDLMSERRRIIATEKVNEMRPELFPKYRNDKFKAYVSISEGCNNFCSYCIVPYVRGRERSRKVDDIIKEVKDLAARGFKDITLLGQNVNSYGKGTGLQGHKSQVTSFVRLLEELNKIEGIERIRFMTSHPKDASLDLFEAMRDLDKVCEHLHLPVQSGSDRILKLMNRGYTLKKYTDLVDNYRKILPEGSITTDILVGFPTESKKDFEKTRHLLRAVMFDSAFMFKYSPRPPARSAKLEDDVTKDVKGSRLEELLELQCAISERRNLPIKGRTVEVLVDGISKKDPDVLTGRTRTNKTAVFKGDGRLIGRFVDIKVGSITPHTLKGKMIK